MDESLTALIPVLSQYRIFQYLQVVGLVILFYDYGLTVFDEIDFVWKRRLNLATIIFLVTRYFPFVDAALLITHQYSVNPSIKTCTGIYNAKSWLFLVTISAAESVLILRTYITYDNNKQVARVLIFLLALYVVGGGYFIHQFLISIRFVAPSPYPAGFPGCVFSSASGILWVSYLFTAIYELGILFFTLLQVVQRNKRSGSVLMKTLTWDGLVAYSCMLGISAVNVVMMNVAPAELSFSLANIHHAIHAVLSARLILSLRRIAVRNEYLSTIGISQEYFAFRHGGAGGGLSVFDARTGTTTDFGSEDSELSLYELERTLRD